MSTYRHDKVKGYKRNLHILFMTTFQFIEMIQTTFHDSIKFSLFNLIKTGNTIVDTTISTLLLTSMSYVVKLLYENHNSMNFIQMDIKSFFFKKNSIIFEGKRSSSISYASCPVISMVFSDSFKALWSDIIRTIDTNPSIYEIKELCVFNKVNSRNSNHNNDGHDHHNSEKSHDEMELFIVCQKRPFLYNKELNIYAIADISTEELSNEKQKPSTKTDRITITLYSYHTSIYDMKEYVNKLKESYINAIEKSRNSQTFIYTLAKTKYDDHKYECWYECPFESTRTFQNIFFEEKPEILRKIQFFLENKDWYYEMGIPYSLGVGLHGPPGTGKTSFFKCLANFTGRHLIVLSLKLIKTRRQLEDFFFEDRYHSNNKPRSVGFDKKIIVFEDIDCLGDIVLRRDENATIHSNTNTHATTHSSTNHIVDILQTIAENAQNDQHKLLTVATKTTDDAPITLDDILNVLDGLRETPGRILGISSNHYNKLDPALIRPGRIDITLKLDNASHPIICEMFYKFYHKIISPVKMNLIKEYFYSPAEIVNCYIMYKEDSDGFIERLQKNCSF